MLDTTYSSTTSSPTGRTLAKMFDTKRRFWKGHQNIRSSGITFSQEEVQQSTLLNLPDEIINSILKFVTNQRDRRKVCLTSHKLCTCMRPIMYRKIRFGQREDYYESSTSRLKILTLYDTLSKNQDLASNVRTIELPEQGGKITKKDVRAVTRRAVEIGIQEKADVSKAWRKRVLRQYRKSKWATDLTHANGMSKDAVFQFYALAASLLLLKVPKLYRLELHWHMYTGTPLFCRIPANWTHLLSLALPNLIEIDLPLHNLDEFAWMIQYLEDYIPRVQVWSYTYRLVRSQ